MLSSPWNLAPKQDLFMGRRELQAGIMVKYHLEENPVKPSTLCADKSFPYAVERWGKHLSCICLVFSRSCTLLRNMFMPHSSYVLEIRRRQISSISRQRWHGSVSGVEKYCPGQTGDTWNLRKPTYTPAVTAALNGRYGSGARLLPHTREDGCWVTRAAVPPEELDSPRTVHEKTNKQTKNRKHS